MKLTINDTFNTELPADKNRNNVPRQVYDACFSYVDPIAPQKATLIHVSDEMLNAIGLKEEDKHSDEFLAIFSGAKKMEGTSPYAMCYGGHQFGHWAGQLGDGRAINLAEVRHNAQQWALQLKGAGRTPYSRSADGLAVLRSSVREHLCSEAMHHLGIPTTRSLSLALTGDQVWRDMLYDGNAAYEKGAVVCRVAPSFIRFGNFQLLTARQDIKNLKILADYTIRHFFPEIKEGKGTKQAYIQFFQEVATKTLDMIIHWQRVGFVHGVMNTDNFSILGLTIDYGPYGWLEGYDHNWTPNTTDKDYRRYRFGNQPGVALWNLAQLGNALYPLVEETEPLEAILQQFRVDYAKKYLSMMLNKLGLESVEEGDEKLIHDLTDLLQQSEVDMTLFFRNFFYFVKDTSITGGIKTLDFIMDAFYKPEELNDSVLGLWQDWLFKFKMRLQKDKKTDQERQVFMNRINPKYVLRNYMAQLAIDQANSGDYSLIEELYQMLKKPYEEQPEYQRWFAKRPEWARNKVGCSMLSCSS
ncbi:protein adenylyltransferase SelO [Aureispira anguillae]|uniref:Protein nucleotidyltransferase YdiU n=1 Tax=Aureispira anguillae TaxID=2864201 RepID=A0A915YLN2_9BACT|nr:YdiU family protein [Aureispira anguillae]BDS15512.1 YdiU family protein [Aureispira anguillae]